MSTVATPHSAPEKLSDNDVQAIDQLRDTYAKLRKELGRIIVGQHAVIERKDTVRVLRLDPRRQQLPRHAEMNHQQALVKSDDDELPAPLDRFNAPPGDLPRQFRAIARRDK